MVNRNNIRGCTCCILLRITKISYQKYSSSFVKSESELMMTDDEWPTIMKQCSLYTTLWWKVERKTNLFHLIKVYTYMELRLTIGAQVILILISGFSHFFSETTLFEELLCIATPFRVVSYTITNIILPKKFVFKRIFY